MMVASDKGGKKQTDTGKGSEGIEKMEAKEEGGKTVEEKGKNRRYEGKNI